MRNEVENTGRRLLGHRETLGTPREPLGAMSGRGMFKDDEDPLVSDQPPAVATDVPVTP